MQFFIIDSDPLKNSKILPDYALKKVNIREGYQMLSDMGHNVGVYWEGQNKPYSFWHAETRRHLVNKESFLKFLEHYESCCYEYLDRYQKLNVYIKNFQKNYVEIRMISEKLPSNRTFEEFTLAYILSAKRDKLTEKEIELLECK